MNRDAFERLQRRFGSNITAWPAPYRQEANVFLKGERETGDVNDDEDLDRIVREAAATPGDERALTREVLKRIKPKRSPIFAVGGIAGAWRVPAVATSFSVVLVAAAVLGYMLAGSGAEALDDALLSFAAGEPIPQFLADISGNMRGAL
ncbi:hypothetical protein [Chelatococcus asaccharovorans]|uniref:Uncharacterized protein n=1 Tax=Chelatococcus asaccharovorans TaxID=28210 RepID=A0A2V3U450_9HYPH|nr:hypothetical protein [Chelatococcus asaccharovorans]MBS7705012.1 hypothetical protein [Chelatococcus asaccharovorans]PXW51927.1 hypothetical protein C7450_11882 [Chelatococcus asaccharovorans]